MAKKRFYKYQDSKGNEVFLEKPETGPLPSTLSNVKLTMPKKFMLVPETALIEDKEESSKMASRVVDRFVEKE